MGVVEDQSRLKPVRGLAFLGQAAQESARCVRHHSAAQLCQSLVIQDVKAQKPQGANGNRSHRGKLVKIVAERWQSGRMRRFANLGKTLAGRGFSTLYRLASRVR